jgi:hypothetical protein
MGAFHWRKQLDEAHPIGECAMHPKERCARRDGLHFVLELPQMTAWACYLVSYLSYQPDAVTNEGQNKNPTASLSEPPPVPLFNSTKAAQGGSAPGAVQPPPYTAAPASSSTQQTMTEGTLILAFCLHILIGHY